MKVKINLICIFLVLSLLQFFASELYAARPLSTDDIAMNPPETFSTELGYEFLQLNSNIQINSLVASLASGFTDSIDFHLIVPFELDPNTGFANALVGLKFRLVEENNTTPAFATTL